jgi:hypothetical protein
MQKSGASFLGTLDFFDNACLRLMKLGYYAGFPLKLLSAAEK